MSGGVDSATSRSGVVENVWVAVGIASPALSVEKLFSLPVSGSGFHFRFFIDILLLDVCRCQAVSAVKYLSRAWSKMWR